jgi:hypothetical protein
VEPEQVGASALESQKSAQTRERRETRPQSSILKLYELSGWFFSLLRLDSECPEERTCKLDHLL